MSYLRRFAKDSSHYLTGRIAFNLLALASFPVVTRLFTVEQYGEMNLMVNVVLIVTTFSKLGLQNAVQRFYREHAEAGPDQLKRYYSSLFLGTSAIAAVTAGLLYTYGRFAPNSILGPVLRVLFPAATALVLIRGVYSIILNLLQAEGRTVMYNLIETLNKALSVGAGIYVLLTWNRTVRDFLFATAAVECVVLLGFIPWLVKRGLLSPREFDRQFFGKTVSFGFPLMFVELGALVLDAGDRILVQYYLGALALGYYGAAYGIAANVRELQIPLGLALFPICMDIWVKQGPQQTRDFLSRTLNQYILAIVWVAAVVTLCSRDVVVILASRKYQSAHTLLPVLVLGILIGTVQIFYRAGLMIHKKSGVLAGITVYSVALNIGLNVLLLPRMGIMGAAIATLASYILQVALAAWKCNPILGIHWDAAATIKYIVISAILIALGWQVHFNNAWAEAAARSAITLLYFPAVLLVDHKSRQGFQALRAQVAGK